MPKRPAAALEPASSPVPWLAVLVFLTGAVILVLEIVGARLISPMFGSSLYVWSSLITVTLLSLAIGYEVGGRIADRFDAHRTLRALLVAAGLFVLLVPALRGPVLDVSARLGLQAGTLAAAAALLLVPLVLLSAAGLVVARASTRSLERLGRGVGRVSFYSTLGSVVGALATGFFLIPRFPVSHIFYGAGATVLAAVALVHLDQRRSMPAATALIVAVAAGGLLIARPEPANGDILLKTETFYGELMVQEMYPFRFLLLDGVHQSLWNTQTRESVGRYIFGLELAPVLSGGDRALVLGLGAGLLPSTLERHYGMRAETVEINPKIVAAARQYFGFDPKGTTHVEDGRTFIRRAAPQSYDLVVLDTFSGDAVPYHLLTREFFGEVRRVLRPAGVLAVNSVGLLGRTSGASSDLRAIVATIRAEFPKLRAFALTNADEAARDQSLGNVLLFASESAPLTLPGGHSWREASRETLTDMLQHELGDAVLGGGVVLTDDYNPIDLMHATTAVEWRKRTIEWAASAQ
jgi:spermidine synthase